MKSTRSSFSASLECAQRLVAAGCPLDYLEGLPETSRRRLYIEPLRGYARSRLVDLGEGSLRYILAFRLGTDLAGGANVTNWGISAPWDQHVTWDFDPRDIVPKADWPSYSDLFDSRLLSVLNGQGRVYAGRPISGLVCGQAYFQSLPKSLASGSIRHAELTISGRGFTVASQLELRFERRDVAKSAYTTRQGTLFEKRDPICESASQKWRVPPVIAEQRPVLSPEQRRKAELPFLQLIEQMRAGQ